MWNDIAGVAVMVAIFAVVVFGCAALYRGMFVRGRTTMNGEDAEDLMFHDSYVRRQRRAEDVVPASRWRRLLRR